MTSTAPGSPTVTRPSTPAHATPTYSLIAGATAGGLLLAVAPLTELVAGDFFLLLPLALVLMLVALPGLRAAQGGADGAAGRLGLRMLTLGLLGAVLLVVVGSLVLDSMSSGAADATEPVLLVAAGAATVAAIVGLGLLTAGMVRASVYPRGAVLLFGPVLLLALVVEVLEQSVSGSVPTALDVLPPVLFFSSGLGLLGIVRAALAARPAHPAGRP